MIHCLHGAVGNSQNWELFQDSLGEKIIPHDLWSLFKNASPSLTEAGKLINAQASPGDILLGYSMGGRLALHSLISSSKWRAAIIISSHPGLTDGHQDRLSKDEQWANLALSDWNSFLTKWNSQSILPSIPEGLSPPKRENQSAVAQSFLQWSLGKQRDLRSQLQNITCPVLWITGQDDQKFTSLAAEAKPLFPHATHSIIPNSGHRVPWEQSELFSDTVRSFLSKIPPPNGE